MPVCKKCQIKFPNRVVLDGKIKSLCSRKYCLMCSPYGSKNTKQLELNQDYNCICNKCNRKYQYQRNSGHTLKFCNSCLANKKRFSSKEKAIEYKGGECQKCGYNKCMRAMAFHHRNPENKSFNISGNHARSWEEIRKELDKCILLCHNCHCELHDGFWTLDNL